MNDSFGASRRARREGPRLARTAAAIIATAVLALLAAACSSPSSDGSAGSPHAESSASPPSAVSYSRCMRSHGVPDFPDPGTSGRFDKAALAQLAASNSQYQTASQTCGHLLPGGSSGRAPAQLRQWWSGMLNFARCMHSHGVPNWPDPTPYPPYPNEPTFIIPASIQPIPQIISKMDECLRLVPNNQVLGHIDNNNWQRVQQQMAGS
jgi:hypothetical protein